MKLTKGLENLVNKTKTTLKYLPLAVTACIAQEVKGQDIVYPSGVINPFLSPDYTIQAINYNKLNSEATESRKTEAAIRLGTSRVKTIPPSDDPIFNCNNWTLVEIMNSYDWGTGIYESDKLLFNDYTEFVISEILNNGGTFADQAKNGIPMFGVTFTIPDLNAAHAYCTILIGNNVLNGKDWCDFEPRDGIFDVQPGQLNLPINTPVFMINLPYIFYNSFHEKNFSYFRIFEFKIVNGEKILTYNVNDDPRYNTRMRVITQRENDNPVIDIKNTDDPDSLVATLTDENLKTVWYQVDGGDTLSLMDAVVQQVTEKKVAIRMNLPPGMHQITLGADDYFNLVTDTTLQREISAPSGTSPAPETEILQVYPNPVKDFLYLTYAPGLKGFVIRELMDAKGTIVYRDRIVHPGSARYPVDFSVFAPGTYMLRQITGKETRVVKIVKE